MDILKQLENIEINEWVMVTPVKISQEAMGKINCTNMYDARSAAFYAMGIAVKNNCKVALCVEGEYLTNIYTAITEAWFQKTKMLIVTLFDRVNDVKTSWINRCVGKVITCMEDEIELYKNEIVNAVEDGIVLLNIIVKREEKEKINYNKVAEGLSEACGEKQKIFFYNADKEVEKYTKLDIRNIEEKDKYGVLSKYIGAVVAGSKGILCCTVDCLLVDTNIFRTRYKDENIKIIILDKNGVSSDKKIDKWIESNGFECVFADVDNKEIYKMLIESKKSTVLIVK